MSSFIQNAIRHKIGLLNLAAEEIAILVYATEHTTRSEPATNCANGASSFHRPAFTRLGCAMT